MITIKYADRNRMVDRWVSVFEEVVLSHQLVRDTKLDEPILTAGKKEVRGEKAISQYVNRLRRDVVTDYASW
ncbi:MAG: hypothetical protein Roseis2KO_39890 [Roseivirga sp.]